MLEKSENEIVKDLTEFFKKSKNKMKSVELKYKINGIFEQCKNTDVSFIKCLKLKFEENSDIISQNDLSKQLRLNKKIFMNCYELKDNINLLFYNCNI